MIVYLQASVFLLSVIVYLQTSVFLFIGMYLIIAANETIDEHEAIDVAWNQQKLSDCTLRLRSFTKFH